MAILPSLFEDAREITGFPAVSRQSLRLRHIPSTRRAKTRRKRMPFVAPPRLRRIAYGRGAPAEPASNRTARDPSSPPGPCGPQPVEPARSTRPAIGRLVARHADKSWRSPRLLNAPPTVRGSFRARRSRRADAMSELVLHIFDRLPDKICFSVSKSRFSMHYCRIKSFIYSFLSNTLFPNGVPCAIMRTSYF